MPHWLETWIDRAPLGHALDLGAGRGETARWLAGRGFQVEAVEREPQAFADLQAACAGTEVHAHLGDLRDYPLLEGRYTLIVAQAVLHFLRPTELWALADRLTHALAPQGLLLAEVFTTDDPGYTALRQGGAQQIEPNTYLAPGPVGLIHYFAPGELRRTFATLEILHYEETRRLDPDSPDGFRAGASLVGRVP